MKKNRKKENNAFTIVFIMLLILVSIAYASLAQNLGVKVTKGGQKEVIVQEPIPEPTPVPEPTPEPEPTPVKPPKKPPKEPTPEPTPDPEPPTPRPPIIKPPVEPSDIDWIIEFENIKELNGSVRAVSPATIDSTKMNIDFSIVLKEPGQYYAFTADVVNKGTTDAEIYNAIYSGLTAQQRRFLSFTVKYNDGTNINVGDTLLQGERKKIKVIVKFKDDDIVAADLPKTQQTLNLSYKITYVEKE